jgi:pseudouridine 5'-phosphatase
MGSVIHGIVFDLDGTLIDTEPLYARATNTVVGAYGRVYEWDTRKDVVGRPELEGARTIVTRLEVPLSPETYLRKRCASVHLMIRRRSHFLP